MSGEAAVLGVALDWVPAHCVVPDGFRKGEPFELYDWQFKALANFYLVKPTATVGQLAPAFVYRRSQIVLPQKAGKAPYTGAHVCLEGVGPALFNGWAEGGEVYDCRDWGCGCGWTYEYQPGEPTGRPWPTPLIQITATSEEQTSNIYDALRPMIDEGPLSVLIPRTGEEFIRLPNKGRIDIVTSNARSRLGQRVTFVPQDETGIWTATTGMVKVAETQRRGLAGMGGRAEETTNAWDPNEGSVAQRTAESKAADIYRYHPLAPRSLKYRNKTDRRKVHRHVYEGCPHVDLDSIEAEAMELLETDPGQAERFFGNNPTAGEGFAFDMDVWKRNAEPDYVPKPGAFIVIGADGALSDDALAVVATEIETGHQWPLGIWERPENADEDYLHPRHEVRGTVNEAFSTYHVWRAYFDPQFIEALVDDLRGRHGEKRVIEWRTNRPAQIGWAVRTFAEDLANGEQQHDGSPVMKRHVENAKKDPLNVFDQKKRRLWTLAKEHPKSVKKIDAAMAAVLSWEARGDAIAAGAKPPNRSAVFL